jgi:hypothetical protein
MRNRIAEFSATADFASSDQDMQRMIDQARLADPSRADALQREMDAVRNQMEDPGMRQGETPSIDPATGRVKFTPKTQPRDAQGRFRDVLARIKQNLGKSGNQDVLAKLKISENLDNTGDYAQAVESAADLINTIDRLDSGALNAVSLENVRLATTDLGKVIANLPLPFGNQAQKIRYSDMPAALKDLTENMIKKVEAKIGKEDAEIATANLRTFMGGSDVYSQAEISSELNKLLRLLT